MRVKVAPYEVRCPRCDVSFPPETRKCIHCGGPTTKPGAVREVAVTTSEAPVVIDERARRAEREPIFSMRPGGIEEREMELDTESSSLPRTIMRSLASLIWIALLIAFTLARDCGGGSK